MLAGLKLSKAAAKPFKIHSYLSHLCDFFLWYAYVLVCCMNDDESNIWVKLQGQDKRTAEKNKENWKETKAKTDIKRWKQIF